MSGANGKLLMTNIPKSWPIFFIRGLRQIIDLEGLNCVKQDHLFIWAIASIDLSKFTGTIFLSSQKLSDQEGMGLHFWL